ncbi:cytochrome P450 [Mycobacterium marinum]|uniref:cytochrome P450 n=2 Tax=Mycobacterium marinum TaxID=1781 RepID=UPI001FB6C8DB|nr:cytochrome P450 [Mycobacterium marinum]
MTDTMLARFDPHDQQLRDDPYAVYATYRQADPVHWGQPFKPGDNGCWYLFRHDHVVAMLRDPRFRRKLVPADPLASGRVFGAPRGFAELSGRLLLSLDPPHHGRLRSIVAPTFTHSAIESYRMIAAKAADRLIDGLEEATAFDVIDNYAVPLSMILIAAMLGLTADELHPDLPVWVSRFGDGFDLRKEPAAIARADDAAANMLWFFETAAASHDRLRPGLISALIAAREAGQLTHEELLALCVQLMFAAHGTTVAQIGNMIADLWTRPDQLALLRAHPELMAAAVNESLRFNGSVQSTAARKPIEDVTLGGAHIRAGQPVIAFVGAANRDPKVFEEPDRFDITRARGAAVMFGAGIHYCLGARLARLECQIAVGTLMRRLPRLTLTERTQLHRHTNIVLPALLHLKAVTAA